MQRMVSWAGLRQGWLVGNVASPAFWLRIPVLLLFMGQPNAPIV